MLKLRLNGASSFYCLLITSWSTVCCCELVYWYFWEWITSVLYSHWDRWRLGSFVLGLQCPLRITGWWSTTFWPASQWDESFFAQSAELRSCQRERKKTAVHARRHTAASDPRDCFLWGSKSPSAGLRSALLVPCFWIIVAFPMISLCMSSVSKNICYDTLQDSEFCLLAAPLDSPRSVISCVSHQETLWRGRVKGQLGLLLEK